MTLTPLDALPLDVLRQRTSAKWRSYPDDVLPMFVAESDFAPAPAIARSLEQAIAIGDTGYTSSDPGLREAFAGFARRRFGWELDPRGIRTTGDVMMGVVEILRLVIEPGDGVVIASPVYPPFRDCIEEAGGVVVPVPLRDTGEAWELDLDGIERAFADGASALLLCNPHNPTGTVHARATLAALAEAAERHGAVVVSDEIHAALTHPGAIFTPFLAASPAAARVGYAVTSASKAFNLAGLKCALMVTADVDRTSTLATLPIEVEWRTGLLGAVAGMAAFADSDEWLDRLLLTLDANRRLVAELLAEHVPDARYRVPDAGYLAWVDFSALGWGEDPARRILHDARIALSSGPTFGPEGRGWARMNFACAPEVLTEAMARIGGIARSS